MAPLGVEALEELLLEEELFEDEASLEVALGEEALLWLELGSEDGARLEELEAGVAQPGKAKMPDSSAPMVSLFSFIRDSLTALFNNNR